MRLRSQRFLADQNLTGGGEATQARRRVGDLADDIDAAALDVAFNQQYESGVDARMQVKNGFACPAHPAQSSRRYVQFEGGLGGSSAVIFAGLNMAEQRKHTVTLHPRNASPVPRNDLARCAPELIQQFGVVLGFQGFCMLGRT